MAKIKKVEARYDPKTNRSTYTRPVRGTEMRPDAKLEDAGAPPAHGQNLAAKKGTDGAAHSLQDRYKKIKEDR